MKKKAHLRHKHLELLHSEELLVSLEKMLDTKDESLFWCPSCKTLYTREKWLENLICPSKKCGNKKGGVAWEIFISIVTKYSEEKPTTSKEYHP